MRVAFGLKAHSGWAALVVLGAGAGRLEVVDRRRLELVREAEAGWAKQPYHAAEELKEADARRMVERAVRASQDQAAGAIREAVRRARDGGHDIRGCALLMGAPMPEWSVAEILAVHFRMHQAEGALFRDALAAAATGSGLRLVPIPEKSLGVEAGRRLAADPKTLARTIAELGKAAGPPWGKDQKDAGLAAWIALEGKTG